MGDTSDPSAHMGYLKNAESHFRLGVPLPILGQRAGRARGQHFNQALHGREGVLPSGDTLVRPPTKFP